MADPTDDALRDLVESVHQLPYGRPSDRTVASMLAERRGTCSTKHEFLAAELRKHFPATKPRVIHRVYRLDRADASALFGPTVAAAVPAEGLVDVHRYLMIDMSDVAVAIDATFPGTPWDGRTSMRLACGAGDDYPCEGDPIAAKRALEAAFCTPSVREPFIAALAGTVLDT